MHKPVFHFRSSIDRVVMCFNAKGDWVPAAEPLHRDVDLRKQQKCGVGPALVRGQSDLIRSLLRWRLYVGRFKLNGRTCSEKSLFFLSAALVCGQYQQPAQPSMLNAKDIPEQVHVSILSFLIDFHDLL